MKNITNCNYFNLLLISLFEDKTRDIVTQLLQTIFSMLDQFPEVILPHVKNMTLYMEFLDILKTIMNFFTFIFKRFLQNEVLENFDKIVGA